MTDVFDAEEYPALLEESQISGWIVVSGRGHVLKRAIGTATGRLMTEDRATRMCARLQKHRPDLDFVIIPVVRWP